MCFTGMAGAARIQPVLRSSCAKTLSRPEYGPLASYWSWPWG